MNSWQERRELFYREVRRRAASVFSPDGTGLLPELNAPWREPFWLLPALLTGDEADRKLAANILVTSWNAPPHTVPGIAETSGREFGIFQSTTLAVLLKRYGDRLPAEAKAVAAAHAGFCARRKNGAAQCDYKFHGSNDNMPMMATAGLILGGEATGNEEAVRHGRWNLLEFRRQLYHTGWASEFNSSTYSPITLSSAARIAESSDSEELREIARGIEFRLWTELVLHFHPGTKLQAGPQSRCYAVDLAGHTHSLQALWWLLFGPEISGRDVLRSLWEPDGREILHFGGRVWSNAAEWCSIFDAEFHFPEELRPLMEKRPYPAWTCGCAEAMDQYGFRGGLFHTACYMEQEFSLGSVDSPMYGGEQTPPFLLTCRTGNATDFRGAATVYPVFLTDDLPLAEPEGENGEKFRPNRGWFYTLQHRNTLLLLGTPALPESELETDTLRLALVFSAYYDDRLEYCQENGAFTILRGDAVIHLQPLLPGNGGRHWRWRNESCHRLLEFLHYSGPVRRFTRAELATCLSGLLLTVTARPKRSSLAELHRTFQPARITDYFSQHHRFVTVQRGNLELEVVMSTDPVGVQRSLVNGRQVPQPRLESTLLDGNSLPFSSGPVPPREPFFPWEELEVAAYRNSWVIGSRGLPGESNYELPSGAVRSNFPVL